MRQFTHILCQKDNNTALITEIVKVSKFFLIVFVFVRFLPITILLSNHSGEVVSIFLHYETYLETVIIYKLRSDSQSCSERYYCP